MEPAHVLASKVRAGELAPQDVVEEALVRIETLEPSIQAWVEVDAAGARRGAAELADRLTQGAELGPLAGVPVGIKDIVDVASLATRAGARRFAHYVPEIDSVAVTRLREAGAVILGKTHTTEFAYLDPAPTRNPWNQAHTPGGSSSGSAAAVAAGMVPLAIGSQTVGSVLRPAGYCGIVGFKPSFGRIPYAGTLHLAASFDHLGVLCACVTDAALALTVLAGHDPSDAHSLDAPAEDFISAIDAAPPPRLALLRSYYQAVAEPEVSSHLDDVVRRLQAAGASVGEASPMAPAAEVAERCQPIMRVEAAQAHAERFALNKDLYRNSIRDLIEAGLSTDAGDYERARAYVNQLRAGVSDALEDFDALLLPTAPGAAPAGLETTGPGIFCGPASFTGLPSISLPSGIGSSGLPFSIQLIGPLLGEAKLLEVAAWVERVLDFHEHPALWR